MVGPADVSACLGPKDALPEELVAGIRVVAAGDAGIPPGLTRKLIDAFTGRLPSHMPEQERQLERLTNRERQVPTAVATGWTKPRSPNACTSPNPP